MKYFSVCSGVGTDHMAFEPLGWECVGFSEIDAFPSAILQHRFPNIKNYGDFTKVTKDEVGSVDLLVGGTPCQSFSISGHQRGLDDPRGNLALEFVELARRLGAKWFIWENVPGVLSNNNGRDFGTFLGKIRQCGYSVVWRTLDAQYYGVPQRRRRVFVIGCAGGVSPTSVLFEPPSLRGNTSAGRTTRKSSSGNTRQSVEISYPKGHVGTIGPTYGAKNYSNHQEIMQGSVVAYAPFDLAQITSKANYSNVKTGEPVPPLNTVSQMHVIGFDAHDDGTTVPGNAVPTMRKGGRSAVAAIHQNSRNEVRLSEDVAYALNGGGGKPGQGSPTILHILTGQTGANGSNISENISHTLDRTSSAVNYGTIVRRLTPRECERLQGYPDDWTQVPWKGKPSPDSLRYKAIGNGIALPVLAWIGQRLAKYVSIS